MTLGEQRRKEAKFVGVEIAFRPLQNRELQERIGTERKIAGLLVDRKALPLNRKPMVAEPLPEGIMKAHLRQAADKQDDQSAYWLMKKGLFRESEKAEGTQMRDWLGKLGLFPDRKGGGNGHASASDGGLSAKSSVLSPPLSLKQATDFVEYYYYGWQLRKNPEDMELKARHRLHKPRLAHAFLKLDSESRSRAIRFLQDIKMVAFLSAQRIAGERKKLDAELADNLMQLQGELSKLEEKKRLETAGIAKMYEGKKKAVEWVKERKLLGMKEFVKGVAMPVSGAITAAATFTGWIAQLVENVPFLTDIPQAAIGVATGLALTGAWAVAKAAKAALDWHMTVVGYKTSRRQAKAEAKLSEKICEEKNSAIKDSKDAADWMAEKFEKKRGRILEKFGEDYARLVSEHGYACPA